MYLFIFEHSTNVDTHTHIYTLNPMNTNTHPNVFIYFEHSTNEDAHTHTHTHIHSILIAPLRY